MNHGYARCSTNESKQDIDRQVRELKQAGAEAIFLEYEHGDAAVKCQLSSLLEQAQPGDTIITLEVSRLARSTKQLCEIIEIIKAKHLRLVIVGSITVDCSNGEMMVPYDDSHFTINVPVELSPPFYAWVATFGKSMKILSPEPVVEGMKKFLQKAAEMYQDE